jgi:hypothetical protein
VDKPPDKSLAPIKLFPKVKEARAKLAERADELITEYMALAAHARDKGNLEVAEAILWKLIDHLPNEDGVRLLDQSSSKGGSKDDGKAAGPTIQIGIALGGVSPTMKVLPPVEIIDVDPHE